MPSTIFLISLIKAIFLDSSYFVSLSVKMVWAFAFGASSSSFQFEKNKMN